MAVDLQKPSWVRVVSGPLNPDDFECIELDVRERLSSPFTICLKGRTLKNRLKLKELPGKPMGVVLRHGGVERFFHGCLSVAEHIQIPLFDPDPTYYQLTLEPLFALLRHTQDCRLFQNMTPLDIIKTILKENQVMFQDKVKQCGKKQREFCVQYNESHFHFVSRLMEEYGIAYYFTMKASQHTLVLTDDGDGYDKLSPSAYDYEPYRGELPQFNRITSLNQCHQVIPQGLGLSDFAFKQPDQKLYTNQKGVSHAVPGQIYRYPGKYDTFNDGEKMARLRLQAEEFQGCLVKGTSAIPGLFPGGKFTVKHHPDSGLNKGYVAFEVAHRLALKEASAENPPRYVYSNTVSLFPDHVSYHPLEATPKPRIHGTQTALVTGKEGEEIWTEDFGRIKVKFHWDIRSKADETSSCWIRVAYPWAAQGWGAVSTPRVGQEVVISYLEGDPDQPLVVGCVYNGTHHPPYLPDEPTKSTFKSNSSKGGEGFNELRFEDKKNEEEIYLHAQKHAAFVIEDSHTTDVNTGSLTTTIHRGDRTTVLKADDEPTNGKGDDSLTLTKGSRTVELQAKGSNKGNLSTTLSRGDHTFLIQEGNEALTLKKGSRTVEVHGDNHLTVSSGNWKVEVKGGDITIQTDGNATHDIKRNLKLKVGGDLDVDVTGKLKMDAKMGVEISGNTGGVKLEGLNVDLKGQTNVQVNANALVTLKGTLVKIN